MEVSLFYKINIALEILYSTMAEIVRTTPVYVISQSGSCIYMDTPVALLLVVSVHVFFYTLKSNYEYLGVKFKGHSDKIIHFQMK